MMTLIDWIAFILLEQKINLSLMKICKNKYFGVIVMPSKKIIC